MKSEMDMLDYDFTSTFEELSEFLENMSDIAEDMFIQIEDREQIEFGRFCLETIDELKALMEGATVLQDRMEEIRDKLGLGSASGKAETTKDGLRKIDVEVTEGMLRQSLLSLTRAKKANLVKVGEQFTIRLPGGEEFTTELIEPGNKLRERGRLRAFYEEHCVKPGDHVLLTEIEKGVWRLEVGARRPERIDLSKYFQKP